MIRGSPRCPDAQPVEAMPLEVVRSLRTKASEAPARRSKLIPSRNVRWPFSVKRVSWIPSTVCAVRPAALPERWRPAHENHHRGQGSPPR